MKSKQGFTLVEMLVSMVLLSMVILIGSGAYSMFSGRWNGRLGHFNQSAKNARQLILVQEALQGIVPYVVTDNDDHGKIYFEGNRNGFVAVTLRSLFTPQMAAVMRLQVKQQADFSYSLIYQEATMERQLLTKAQQKINFGKEIVLFANLTSIEFSYFGWPSSADKYWSPENFRVKQEPKEWANAYNSLETDLQPEQVQIDFSSEQGVFKLQSRLTDAHKALIFRSGGRNDV